MGVTILNLQVTTGICDPSTCEFIERVGGTLSENVLIIGVLGRSNFDEVRLRQEVAQVAQDVGYAVSSIISDCQASRSQELASYYLRRKVFLESWIEQSVLDSDDLSGM